MKLRKFEGDFFEIGVQKGEIYQEKGLSDGDFRIPERRILKKQLSVYRRHYPGFLEELKGISHGSGIDENLILGKFIAQEDRDIFRKSPGACTILGVKEGDKLFVGRNYDFPPATEKIFESFESRNSKAFSFVGVTDMDIGLNSDFKFGISDETKKGLGKLIRYTPIDSINEKGLFIGLTKAYHKDVSFGLFSTHIMKLISETCETVEDALKVFRKVPLAHPQNFFVADAKGDMVAVEHASGRKFDVVHPSRDGILIHTNHFLSKKFLDDDLVLDVDAKHNTFLRYYEAFLKINVIRKDREFSKKDAREILTAKGSHCFETGKDVRFIKTIWTLSMEMTSKDYDLWWDLTERRKGKKIDCF